MSDETPSKYSTKQLTTVLSSVSLLVVFLYKVGDRLIEKATDNTANYIWDFITKTLVAKKSHLLDSSCEAAASGFSGHVDHFNEVAIIGLLIVSSFYLVRRVYRKAIRANHLLGHPSQRRNVMLKSVVATAICSFVVSLYAGRWVQKTLVYQFGSTFNHAIAHIRPHATAAEERAFLSRFSQIRYHVEYIQLLREVADFAESKGLAVSYEDMLID